MLKKLVFNGLTTDLDDVALGIKARNMVRNANTVEGGPDHGVVIVAVSSGEDVDMR